ncbi:MAG: GtrA family protein [Oscillospiraceae bacterium]|nr:GtrA family protein [Oscillospiraceae bacterium]
MIEKIKALCIRYRELIVYIIVGGLTTVVGWGTKFLWNILFYGGTAFPTSLQNAILSVVEWVAGVAFAYPTNHKWVFQSKNPDILKEASGFVASRLATLGLNFLAMQLLVNLLHVNFYVSTIIAGVLVIIGNYVFSKLFVFKKKG